MKFLYYTETASDCFLRLAMKDFHKASYSLNKQLKLILCTDAVSEYVAWISYIGLVMIRTYSHLQSLGKLDI